MLPLGPSTITGAVVSDGNRFRGKLVQVEYTLVVGKFPRPGAVVAGS